MQRKPVLATLQSLVAEQPRSSCNARTRDGLLSSGVSPEFSRRAMEGAGSSMTAKHSLHFRPSPTSVGRSSLFINWHTMQSCFKHCLRFPQSPHLPWGIDSTGNFDCFCLVRSALLVLPGTCSFILKWPTTSTLCLRLFDCIPLSSSPVPYSASPPWRLVQPTAEEREK